MSCSRAALPVQSTYMSAGTIDQDSVYATAGKPLPRDIEDCACWLLNEPLSVAFQREWS